MNAVGSIVVLDTGPLGLVSNPKASKENDACRQWLENLVAQGRRVLVPEIADYEARRELLRANKGKGILRLDRVKAALEYVPIMTQARQQGQPNADIRTVGSNGTETYVKEFWLLILALKNSLGVSGMNI